MSRILDFIEHLVPPDDPQRLQRWRGMVFLALVALAGTLALHLAASKGLLEFVGIDGVAHASEVRQNGKTSRAILRRLFLPEIRANVRALCRTDPSDTAERERILKDRDRLLEQWFNDTGEEFGDLPTCADV